jgi:hypothetical protein
MPDAFMTVHRQLIILLAARYSLPAIYPYRYQAAEGGLLERSLLELRAAEQSASGRISTTVGVTTTPLPEAPTRQRIWRRSAEPDPSTARSSHMRWPYRLRTKCVACSVA